MCLSFIYLLFICRYLFIDISRNVIDSYCKHDRRMEEEVLVQISVIRYPLATPLSFVRVIANEFLDCIQVVMIHC